VVPVTVTLGDTDPNATFGYTTDGTTPTLPRTGTTQAYTVPFTMASAGTYTIKAIANSPGYLNSAIASNTYTFTIPLTATPVFQPTGGILTYGTTAVITDTTSGSTIYYTTDGSTPTTGSTVYAAPIPITITQTLRAIATAPGYLQSNVGSASYSIPPLTITTTSLPGATVGVAYNFSMQGSGGAGPSNYTWAIVSGAPAWLTINATSGLLSGTPTTTGTYSIVISLTD